MRTTVNIDEHLLAEAKVRAARTHRSLGDIIDEALRQRFAVADQPAERRSLPTFGVPGERVLVDLDDRDAVAELLGDNTRSTELLGDNTRSTELLGDNTRSTEPDNDADR